MRALGVPFRAGHLQPRQDRRLAWATLGAGLAECGSEQLPAPADTARPAL